jgi:hypothetical protein
MIFPLVATCQNWNVAFYNITSTKMAVAIGLLLTDVFDYSTKYYYEYDSCIGGALTTRTWTPNLSRCEFYCIRNFILEPRNWTNYLHHHQQGFSSVLVGRIEPWLPLVYATHPMVSTYHTPDHIDMEHICCTHLCWNIFMRLRVAHRYHHHAAAGW